MQTRREASQYPHCCSCLFTHCPAAGSILSAAVLINSQIVASLHLLSQACDQHCHSAVVHADADQFTCQRKAAHTPLVKAAISAQCSGRVSVPLIARVEMKQVCAVDIKFASLPSGILKVLCLLSVFSVN